VHPGFRAVDVRRRSATVAHERRRAGQHHAVLADEQRDLGGAAVLGERRARQRDRAAAQKTAEISLPVAITVFPRTSIAPGDMGRRAYRNLIYFNEADKGGHFAAWKSRSFSLRSSVPRSDRSVEDMKVIHRCKTNKLLIAAVLAIAIAAPIAGFFGEKSMSQQTSQRSASRSCTDIPRARLGPSELNSLERANAWLNSSPLTASDLRGKVVLIDFWTYTCINGCGRCRTSGLGREIQGSGLVVIGVHAPEFAFEKNSTTSAAR
jgi:plasmid stability protein